MHKIDNDLPPVKDILIHYGATLRATRGQVNLKCPFHSDTHQSGSANLDKNIYICFACGVQGNSIQLIQLQEKVDFREAKRIAEGITGESNGEIRGAYTSGRKLPSKQGNNKGSSAANVIRRSRRA